MSKRTFVKRLRNSFLIIIITLVVILTLVGIALGIYVSSITERELDEGIFDLLRENSASKIYYYESDGASRAADATELETEELFGGYRSLPVDYSEIPPDLINAFVSIEDKRFFEHSGVDWKRTIGAALNYILRFDGSFGGSTITQQLIKNVTERDEYTLERKIQEILWALDLERKMSKSEILQNYLNIINLSNGCYGVGAAADYYFSKSLDELTLFECASIAAITNNPSYYDPRRNPENNRERALLILSQMYEQGYIESDQYESAKKESLALNIRSDGASSINLWYVDMVLEDVIRDLMAEKGYTRAMANMAIYRGGLKIYTAMDYQLQLLVEKYYANASNFGGVDGSDGQQSAIILIDTQNGDVLAVAGAIGEKSANRLQNFATSTVRPAGSVIKPLSVYAPALDAGIITWSTVYDDVPINFGNASEPKAWPKNANGVYRGLTNINYAIEHSVNTVTVRVLEDLGLERSFDFLYNKLGMKSLIDERVLDDGRVISDIDYAALALGQFNYGVSVREISAAYSIFASGGIYNGSRSYYKVTDSLGNVILENKYHGEAVISEESAAIMHEMLKNVVESGTASALTLKKIVECAGKTGTTQKNFDRWYIGYTPYCIGGVWYGYEYPKELDSSTSGICVRIWDEIMSRVDKIYSARGERAAIPTSENIGLFEYCKDSGKLVGEACRRDARGDRSEQGYFVLGTEPSEKCDCHVLVPYDRAEGGVASEWCYAADVEYIGMINVERSFPIEIYISDAQYVWRELPDDVLPETSPSLPYFNNLLGEDEYCGISYGTTQFNRYCRAHFDYWKWREKRGNAS
ncbi:MAG: transglycosylase domain-containing protein [Clostridia bacterium]|nr:transglycosylase domain-containing protein [Clostridia bacterium]